MRYQKGSVCRIWSTTNATPHLNEIHECVAVLYVVGNVRFAVNSAHIDVIRRSPLGKNRKQPRSKLSVRSADVSSLSP
jgi:hypothetical protein